MKFLKITSMLLVLVMLLSTLPISANALDKLPAPAEVYWSNTIANWSLVDNAYGYKVQVYKDGVYQGASIFYFEITEKDLLSYMEHAGAGYYSFCVVALGDGTVYQDGEPSALSDLYPYGVEPIEPSSPTQPTQPDESEYLIGDVDLDGVISIKDVTTIQLHLARYITFTDLQLTLADTLVDGSANVKDATYIQMYLAHYVDSLG